MSKLLIVGISDMKIGKPPSGLITYALGSCIGTCIYDQKLHLGGMVHIMLPNAPNAATVDNIFKYADTGIAEMVRKMEVLGASRARMVAKIAGGARMFEVQGDSSIGNIGARNASSVKMVLSALRIPIIGETTGGTTARTMEFYTDSGAVKIRSYGCTDIMM